MIDRHPRAQLYGIDISEKMIDIARTKLPKVYFSVGDVHELPFTSGYFDCVVTTEAFHHYYDQLKALKEMARVAKKGGKVIVVDVNFFLQPIHWIFEHFEPGCVRINSKKDMRKLFQHAGLHVMHQRRNWIFAVVTVGVKRSPIQPIRINKPFNQFVIAQKV
jgi:ubiquinone/menaquinone biosynthesis C-methylase UbiE